MLQKRMLIIGIIASYLLCYGFCFASVPGHMDVEPNVISIGASYNGSHVLVKGDIAKDADIVIELSDASEDISLLKKGKALGVLWMNVGTVTFKDLPEVYLLYLPESIPISALSQHETSGRMAPGFKALEDRASIIPPEEDKEQLFQELIKLKTAEGLYVQQGNAVIYQPAQSETKPFSCDIQIPSKIKHGTYTITATVMKNGKEINAFQRSLKIQETGLPALISALAFQHGTLYGVMATVIAIVSGLLIGFVFKEGGSH